MLTDSDVFQACEKLLSNGELVSLINLRKHLGTGSFTTIAKHLKSWEDSKIKSQIRAEIGFDQALQQAISAIAPMLFDSLMSIELKSIQSEKIALSALLSQKENTVMELAKRVDSLQNSVNWLEQERVRLQGRESELDLILKNQEQLVKSYQCTNDSLTLRLEEKTRDIEYLKTLLMRYRERFGSL